MRGRLLLAAISAVVVAGVLVLRSTSTFAAVARRVEEARAVAARCGLAPADVLAILDLAPDLDAAGLAARAAKVQAETARYGDLVLGVACAFGLERLVEEGLARHGGDIVGARIHVRRAPEGILIARFASMAPRYRAWLEHMGR